MRTPATRVALALTALVVLATTSGCAKAASAPTKDQYIAVADSVCDQAHNDAMGLIATQKKAGGDATGQQAFVQDTLIPRLKGMVGQLESIQPPDGDGEYLASIYNDYVTALGVWFLYPLGTEADSNRAAVDVRLRAYGMKDCVKVADPRPTDTTTTTTTPPSSTTSVPPT